MRVDAKTAICLASHGFLKSYRTASDGKWCPGSESNQRHRDFQSLALPTELPGHGRAFCIGEDMLIDNPSALVEGGIAAIRINIGVRVRIVSRVCRDDVTFSEPAAKINVLAAFGAEGTEQVLGRFAANRARFREGVRRQHAQCYRAQTRPDDTVFFLPYSGFNFF